MKIHLIFVHCGDAAWLHGAWDELTLEENPPGYAEELEKARNCGEVRVATITIKGGYEAVKKLFAIPDFGSVTAELEK